TVALVSCDFIFFSSRRRHTKSYGDWSSDVCSSDLRPASLIYHVGRASPEGGALPCRGPSPLSVDQRSAPAGISSRSPANGCRGAPAAHACRWRACLGTFAYTLTSAQVLILVSDSGGFRSIRAGVRTSIGIARGR